MTDREDAADVVAEATGARAKTVKTKAKRRGKTAAQGDGLTDAQREALGRCPTVRMRLTELVPASYNPRKITTENLGALGQSILDFSLVQPIVWNSRTGRVCGGHQRLDRLLHFKVPDTDVRVVDLDEAAEMRLSLTLNNVASMGEFTAALGDCLTQVKAAGEAEYKALRLDALAKIEDVGPVEDRGGGDGEGVVGDDSAVKTRDGSKDAEGLDGNGNAYCAVGYMADIGRGRCGHGCVYCYVLASRNEGSLTAPGPTRDKDIVAAVEAAKLNMGVLFVGSCIDPGLPQLEKARKVLLDACKVIGVPVRFATKDPGACLASARAADIDPRLVQFNVACAFWHDDAKAHEAEPGAPLPSTRLAVMREAASAGHDVLLRMAPLFCGYYDAAVLGQVLDAAQGVQRVVVEPFRFSATWSNRRLAIGRLLDRDSRAVDAYWRRWNPAGTMYGPYHWYDYADASLYGELARLQAVVHAHGMTFGVCNPDFGWRMARLNDGPFCCATRGCADMKYDAESWCALVAAGREGELTVPALHGCLDRARWQTMAARVVRANDPDDQMFVPKE